MYQNVEGARRLDGPAAEDDGCALLLSGEDGRYPEPLPPDRAVLRCRGEFWEVAFAGKSQLLRDRKGLRYLVALLRQPWEELHALDLMAPATHAESRVERAAPRYRQDLGTMLDRRAKAAYRDRLGELRTELVLARAANDPARVARAQYEIELVTRELCKAIGLGGRARRTGSAAERARLNVTRAIKAALRSIMDHNPRLGHHLLTTIRTGTYCLYAPNPRRPIPWDL